MGPFHTFRPSLFCPGGPWWLLGFLLLGLAACGRAASPDCTPAPNGLVSWWPGDGSAQDIAGTNHGTLQEGATAALPGLVGSAFSFDGTNQYLQIPDAPALRATNLTLEAWVCFADLDSSTAGGEPPGRQFIIFKQNSRRDSFEGYALSKTRIGDQDVFSFIVSSALGETVETLSSSLIRTSVWYHIAAVRRSSSLELYVNGQLESQAAVSFAQDYGDFPLYFGTSGQAYWDAKFKGRLDEVAFYDQALSAEDIQALFAAGDAGKCKGPIITIQPQSQTVTLGHDALMWVAASGLLPLTYQWHCNGTDLIGATSTSLTLTNVQFAQAGSYTVQVSNPVGVTLSAPAMLMVSTLSSPGFLADPNLNRAIAAALGKGTGPVTQLDLSYLTALTACGQHITNLTGLEYASNLTCLTLSANGIEDLAPLSELHALAQVTLDRNRISNLSPLVGLSSLTNLNLSDNFIEDGQSLASLTRLVRLSLNNNGLRDLSFLQSLRQLRSLDLGHNPLTDISALASLTSLEALTLGGNPLVTNFTALSGLTRLTSLSLRESAIGDLSLLKNLEELRFLDLYNNPGLTDLSPLRSLRQLNRLDLSWNAGLTNCAVLAGSTNLTELSLRGIALGNVSFLQPLGRLSVLNLDTTQMSDPAPVASLTNLNYLALSGNPTITNFSGLSNLTSLVNLELSRNALSNLTFLSSLRRLSYADLAFNQVTDLSPLTSLTNLTSLVLAGNPATNFTRLAPMTALTNLWLLDANLNDAGWLKDWTGLKHLNLEGNCLTNLSPLAGLTNLTGLGLSRNPLAAYQILAGLTNLTSLKLDGNRLTNLAFLSNLTHLTFLSLNTNHLTDLSALTRLTQLQDLYLRRNWLREIELLETLSQLLDVDLSLNLLSQSTNTPSALTVVTNMQVAGVQATCLPANQPPTLSTANQWHLARNSTWSNSVLVLDDETPASQLVVTAVSLNPQLVSILTSPLPGTNTSRALAFSSFSQTTPAILILTVTDEAGLSATTNLLVTVEPLSNLVIPDPQLEAAIRTQLNQTAGALTTADLLALTDLAADKHAITNLAGLEWALNLTTLGLGYNAITDLTPLQHLPQLAFLNLNHNRIPHVAPLAGLTNLAFLSLQNNLITNIDLLPPLPPFSYLDLRFNLLNDAAAIQTIQRLTNQQVNVTYQPQREPPILILHTNWTIRANLTSRLPFEVRDTGQASADLTITVASSNLNLLPTVTAFPIAEGNLWVLAATPTPAQTGSATLTLTALNDAGLRTTAALPVMVVNSVSLPSSALGNSNLTWVTWGHTPWQAQGRVTPDGLAAIQTGSLSNDQEAWLETTLTGPGRLLYWCKVSSETNFDGLEFYIDERLQANRLSGEVDWRQQVIDLPGGNHTLHWRYAKDTDTSAGLDTAWLGGVSFLPGAVVKLAEGPTNGWCRLLLYGASDRLYDLQVSTNLDRWGRLDLVQGSTQVLQSIDNNATGPGRFYRLQPVWLESAGPTTNGFHLLLHCPPDLRFQLQTSSNLLDWSALLTTTGALHYLDAVAPNTPQRFYRALLQP